MALRPSLTTRHPAADQSVKLWNLLTSLKVRVTTFTTTTQNSTTPRASSAHERSRACSETETRPHPPPRVRFACSVSESRQAQGKCSHTFGALDPIQVVQMAAHVSTVYVSGWQCSSTASTRSVRKRAQVEVGPGGRAF